MAPPEPCPQRPLPLPTCASPEGVPVPVPVPAAVGTPREGTLLVGCRPLTVVAVSLLGQRRPPHGTGTGGGLPGLAAGNVHSEAY